ncbi:ABC transporter permease [Lentzea nigeriaca]|uniref:ABC transporter permease n=1 Tax=Lentzea nigeriaca TaxID=1128665 RepID=UPI00195B4360|nr:ABC transporter permease [Lentzea nigeriaca]MBM7857021.1 ABC-2 type transport system permease protein [Lentzea nigeriaca]
MRNALAAEWLKLRTVRAPYGLIAAIGLMVAFGATISWLLVQDYDTSPAAEQAKFASADASVVINPVVQFCVAALGALVATSDPRLTALTAVPDRKRLLAAKSALVATTAVVIGTVALALSIGSSRLIMGDRPPPVAPWDSVSDVLPWAGAAVLSILVTGLIGLGLGLALRSTAVAVVVVGVLLWGLPAITPMLPEPWNMDVSGVMVPYLVYEVAGVVENAPLSPLAAVACLLVYAVVTLGTGMVTLLRRDA